MIAVLLVLQALAFLVILWCAMMLFRNKQVHDYRIRILDSCIPGSKEFDDRIKTLDSVSYDEMMMKFWVWPLTKFYENTIVEDVK